MAWCFFDYVITQHSSRLTCYPAGCTAWIATVLETNTLPPSGDQPDRPELSAGHRLREWSHHRTGSAHLEWHANHTRWRRVLLLAFLHHTIHVVFLSAADSVSPQVFDITSSNQSRFKLCGLLFKPCILLPRNLSKTIIMKVVARIVGFRTITTVSSQINFVSMSGEFGLSNLHHFHISFQAHSHWSNRN